MGKWWEKWKSDLVKKRIILEVLGRWCGAFQCRLNSFWRKVAPGVSYRGTSRVSRFSSNWLRFSIQSDYSIVARSVDESDIYMCRIQEEFWGSSICNIHTQNLHPVCIIHIHMYIRYSCGIGTVSDSDSGKAIRPEIQWDTLITLISLSRTGKLNS